MKRLLLYLVLLLSSCCIRAQQFAPVGAEWYNEAYHGIFHIRVVGDTVINNNPSRRIAYQSHIIEPWASYGFWLQNPSPRYVYNTDDTVFVYNVLFKKFTPLYVFNVNDGDTVSLPLTLPNNGCAWFMGNLGDSLFSFVVDSVRAVLYDTSYLQTVYTRSLSMPGRQKMSFPVYARVLGSLETGLLPNCDSCAISLSDNCVGPDAMRCYNSSTQQVKLVSDDCAKGIKVSAPVVVPTGIRVTSYPNPASGVVTIRLSHPAVKALLLELTNMEGKRVLSELVPVSATDRSYAISHLPLGVYTLRLLDGLNTLYSSKLQVQH